MCCSANSLLKELCYSKCMYKKNELVCTSPFEIWALINLPAGIFIALIFISVSVPESAFPML